MKSFTIKPRSSIFLQVFKVNYFLIIEFSVLSIVKMVSSVDFLDEHVHSDIILSWVIVVLAVCLQLIRI